MILLKENRRGQDGNALCLAQRVAHRDRGNRPGRVLSYDLTGKELWRMSGMRVHRFPAFRLRRTASYQRGRGRPLFAIRPGAAGDISLGEDERSNAYVVWSARAQWDLSSSSLAYEGAVYTLTENGILSRFDARTGKQTYKTRMIQRQPLSQPALGLQRQAVLLERGGPDVRNLDGREIPVLHVNELHDMAQATPALVGDRLLLRTEHWLYSIRRERPAGARKQRVQG